MHRGFGLPLPGFLHTGSPHFYRDGRARGNRRGLRDRLAQELEELILREDPATIGAFFAEPIMGAGGVILPPATYFEKIQTVLKKYNVLFVADEVICGFCRTGNYLGLADLQANAGSAHLRQGIVRGLLPDLGGDDDR